MRTTLLRWWILGLVAAAVLMPTVMQLGCSRDTTSSTEPTVEEPAPPVLAPSTGKAPTDGVGPSTGETGDATP
jgi:hypothetical protein